MEFCSVNCYSSARKSEHFGALKILFLEVIFVHIVIEILPGQTYPYNYVEPEQQVTTINYCEDFCNYTLLDIQNEITKKTKLPLSRKVKINEIHFVKV